MSEISNITGKRIKIRRKELGVSAEKIASEIGVAPATIYRYESGRIKKIPASVLEPLANFLQTTPAWLAGWDS